jgi:flagellar hook-associated protein 2
VSSGISFSGLGSGIDTESLIARLVEIEKRPATAIQKQQTRLKQQQAAYSTVSARLIGMQTTAYNLNRLRSFDLVTATTSNTDAVTVTADTGAQIGSHTITITQLAKAQKISTGMQSSQTTALGVSGQILVNGKAITVSASDSLQTIAGNINSAGVGVSASIISPTTGEFYLTLGSNNTGAQGKITISDTGSGNVLQSLGMFNATAPTVRSAIGASGAGSSLFSDSGTSVGTLLGLTSPASGTVVINGQNVSIDLATDSLSVIAGKINTADPTAGASVVTVTDPITGNSRQQLQMTNFSSSTDSNHILENLGILQKGYGAGRELTQGQNATFTLDGLTASRPTNTITDAISGVTFTLKADGGATSNVTVNRDTSTIKSNVEAFVKAFNDTMDTVASYSTYDPDSGATGILFGDGNMQSLVDGLYEQITENVDGLAASMANISQAGVSLNQNGRLEINDAELMEALNENLDGVAKLFRAYGTPTNSAVQFVSSTDKTHPSSPGLPSGFEVVITQAAKQASLQAGMAGGTLAANETLTFGGALFGTSLTDLTGGYTLTLQAGSTLLDVAAKINGDTKLGAALTASVVGGKLEIVSKQYGSNVNFAVQSNTAASGTSTGIGTAIVSGTGVNVGGTINGETATGSGQFLTGSLTGGKADGLQLRITATAAGNYGYVTLSRGVADLVRGFVTQQTDAFTGGITLATNSLDKQLESYNDDLETLADRVKNYEDNLRLRFAAMEGAVIRIKSASAGLASLATLQSQ